MDNGYLSGLLRPPSQPPNVSPLLTSPPSWGPSSRGPGLHPSHVHSPLHPPSLISSPVAFAPSSPHPSPIRAPRPPIYPESSRGGPYSSCSSGSNYIQSHHPQYHPTHSTSSSSSKQQQIELKNHSGGGHHPHSPFLLGGAGHIPVSSSASATASAANSNLHPGVPYGGFGFLGHPGPPPGSLSHHHHHHPYVPPPHPHHPSIHRDPSGASSLFSPGSSSSSTHHHHHPSPNSSSFHSVSGAAVSEHSAVTAAGNNSFTQALLNLSKVPAPSPRNSIASSSVVTSVSSSQQHVLKRESGSAFSAPLKSSSSILHPSPKQQPPSIFAPHDVIEEEEVLVDDFDGQCCRTYPLNHSRILKWMDEKKRAKQIMQLSKENTAVTTAVTKTIPPTSVVSPASSTSSTTSVPLASNSNSAIPVGIAIGRQRQLHDKSSLASGSKDSSSKRGEQRSSVVSSGSSSSGVGASVHQLDHHHPPPSGPLIPLPPWSGGHSGAWPMDFNNSSSSSSTGPSSSPWPNPSHLGPIPMGYQLAKDPLTGQILLIPTDGAGPPRPNPSLWGPFDGTSGASGTGLSPYPLPYPTHPPPSMQHTQLYLQQQQHMAHFMRHHPTSTFHPPQPSNPSQQHPTHHHLHHSLQKQIRSVPETINLGSSSDEEEENKQEESESNKSATSSVAKEQQQRKSPPLTSGSLVEKEEKIIPSPKPPVDEEILPLSKENEEDAKTNEEDISINQTAALCSSSSSSTPILQMDASPSLEKNEPVLSGIPKEETSPPVKVEKDIEPSVELPGTDIQIKSEVPEPQEEDASLMEDDIKVDETLEDSVVEALLSLGNDLLSPKDSNPYDGFDALISALETSLPNFDEESNFEVLLRAVNDDSVQLGLLPRYFDDAYHLDLGVLCQVTAGEHASFRDYVDPLVLLRSKYDLHHYHHPEQSQEFIANRIKRSEKDEEDKYEGIKSLAAMVKKIKNTEIMSQLEVELRGALVQIQSSYREKQLSLKALSPLKKNKRGRSALGKRPPGRPKKKFKTHHHTFISNIKSEQVTEQQQPRKSNSSSDNDADEEYEYEDEDLSPPILEPAGGDTISREEEEEEAIHLTTVRRNTLVHPSTSGQLLKPPKLTAASSSNALNRCQVTNLSTIKARFMRGKENPFANLMKLATTPSSSKPGSTKSGDESDNEYHQEEGQTSHEEEEQNKSLSDPSSDEEDEISSVSSSQKDLCMSALINTISKRKPDNPQKHCASTETLVTKKPKNLFMMNRLKYPSSFSEEKDEYEFEDEESNDEQPSEEMNKKVISFADYNPPRSPAKVSETIPKSCLLTSSQEPVNPPPKNPSQVESTSGCNGLRSAKLTADDLKDGLRLLMLNDGRFWPARLDSTRLPDVYGVVMEKQRGNRPQILPRDDILQECIMEVKPESKDQIPPGTRVCVYWSSAYNCLFPGTVESNDSLIQVELDDGDTRDVVIGNVRMLPYNYSHVFHDPDPIATLRKRRQSSDSAEGGCQLLPTAAAVPPSKSSLSVPSTPTKSEPEHSKPKKKHKHRHHKHHHRCKRRHKKHKPLRVKLDGTFNNTTTYSIRSPPVYSNSSRVAAAATSTQGSTNTHRLHLGSQKGHQQEESDDEDQSNNEDQEEDESSDSDHEEDHERSQMSFFKGKTSSKFNHVTGRPLWVWGDEGYRRPGSKGKAKKLFHRSITRESESLSLGDCAVFLSMAQVDRPYIGRIDAFWETWNSRDMMVKVKWFYHPEEIETSEKNLANLKIPGGLFQSSHMDENDVQTISHKCWVIPFKDYSPGNNRCSTSSSSSISEKTRRKNTYYLAGNYEPGNLSVQCLPGVILK